MNVTLVRSSLSLVLLLVCGCQVPKMSETTRTISEQLLLSSAADDALAGADLRWVKGRRVFLDDTHFEGYDKGYVISLIRERLSLNGALLARTETNSEFIVEIRSAAHGLDVNESLIGIPSIVVPVPLSGPIKTPEIAIYKSKKASALGKFAIFAYGTQTGQPVKATGPLAGSAHLYTYKLIGIGWRKTDVLELTREFQQEQGRKTVQKHPYEPFNY